NRPIIDADSGHAGKLFWGERCMVVPPEDAEGVPNPASWPFRALWLHAPKRPISWSSRSFNGTHSPVLVDTGAGLVGNFEGRCPGFSREDARVFKGRCPS